MKRCYSCMQWVKDGVYVCPSCGKPITAEKRDRLDLRPGSVLQVNRYEVGRSLGRGGNGATYIAVEHLRGDTERLCAIKECFPIDFCLRINDDPRVRLSSPGYQQSFEQALGRFREEVLFLESLQDYPCAVRYLNQFYENGTMYLVMEYADKSLSAHMHANGGPLSVEEAEEKIKLVLRALDALHSIPYPCKTGTSTILHRDICMDNLCLFTQPDGKSAVKLIDFGSHALVSDQLEGRKLPRSKKAGYTSPEQYRDEYQDTCSDVYSAAMVLYKMLCGHCPDEKDEVRITHAADIHKERPDVPQWLRDIILKATQPDPKDRYQTAKEFLRAMETHGGKRSAISELIDTEKVKKMLSGGKKAPLMAAAAAVLVLLAGTALFSGGEKEVKNPPVATAAPVQDAVLGIELKNKTIFKGENIELHVQVSGPTDLYLLLNNAIVGDMINVPAGQSEVVLSYSTANLDKYVYNVGVRYREKAGGKDYPQSEELRILQISGLNANSAELTEEELRILAMMEAETASAAEDVASKQMVKAVPTDTPTPKPTATPTPKPTATPTPKPTATPTPKPTATPTPKPTKTPTPRPTATPTPMLTAEQKLAASLKNARVGDVVAFGRYQQDRYGTRQSPIQWIVLEKRDGKMLLLTESCIDSMTYHKRNTSVTWETCSLREWLNSSFINQAFSATEQGLILTVQNENKSCGPTYDRAFLLDVNEARQYFASNYDRRASATEYAFENGAYPNSSGNVWWWLRNTGKAKNYAAGVKGGGEIDPSGDPVNMKNGNPVNGVRPAMWIDIDP